MWQQHDILRRPGHEHQLHISISKFYTNFYIKIIETEILVFSPHPFLKPLLLTPDFLHQTHIWVCVKNEDSWSRRSESVGGEVTEHRASTRSGAWPAMLLRRPPLHHPCFCKVTCLSPVQNWIQFTAPHPWRPVIILTNGIWQKRPCPRYLHAQP